MSGTSIYDTLAGDAAGTPAPAAADTSGGDQELVVPNYGNSSAEGDSSIYGDDIGAGGGGLSEPLGGGGASGSKMDLVKSKMDSEVQIAKEAWSKLEDDHQKRCKICCAFLSAVVILLVIIAIASGGDDVLTADEIASVERSIAASHVGSGPGCASAKSCKQLRVQYHGGWPNHTRTKKTKKGAKFSIGGGSPLVCGESDQGLGPDIGWSNSCGKKKGSKPTGGSHSAAEGVCLGVGARLCTVNELLAGETANTGCGHNSRMVWTSDRCHYRNKTYMDGFMAVAGHSEHVAQAPPHCYAPATTTATSGPIVIRCCADVRKRKHGGGSAKTCKQLKTQYEGWPTKGGSPLVCGESDNGLGPSFGFTSQCATDKHGNAMNNGYWMADMTCLAVGARLCTLEELEDDNTRGTGCGGDSQRVWSSTPCQCGDLGTRGHLTTAGNHQYIKKVPRACTPNNEKLAVRCCADTMNAKQQGKPVCASRPRKENLCTSAMNCSALSASVHGTGWLTTNGGSSTVCGETDSGLGAMPPPGTPRCVGGTGHVHQGWDEAAAVCSGTGARLCTVSEMDSGQTVGTGCGHDGFLSWTNARCTKDGVKGSMHMAVPGNKLNKKGLVATCTLDSDQQIAVRCCADVVSRPDGTTSRLNCSQLKTKYKPPRGQANPNWRIGNGSALSNPQVGGPPGSPSVCAESDILVAPGSHQIDFPKICHAPKSKVAANLPGVTGWAHANSICLSSGARLCSLEEMVAGETRGTGCGMDAQPIWTSTKANCTPGSHYVAPGSMGAYKNALAALRAHNGTKFFGKVWTYKDVRQLAPHCVRNDADHAGVRCCADVKTTAGSTCAAPTYGKHKCTSSASCEMLRVRFPGAKSNPNKTWDAPKYAGAKVCAEADNGVVQPVRFKGNCSGGNMKNTDDGFSHAERICIAAGARLCTLSEIMTDVTAGTGCMHDNQYVWTSTSCMSSGQVSHMVAPGNSKLLPSMPPKCETSSKTQNAVRCCADVHTGKPGSSALSCKHMTAINRLGWPVRKSTPTVCGESDSGLNNNVTFDDTKSACNTHGAVADGNQAVQYGQAQAICMSIGARMCSSDEVIAGEATGSGCPGVGLDPSSTMVWTKDPCGLGGRTVSPRDPGAKSLCVMPWDAVTRQQSKKYSVVCCADVKPDPNNLCTNSHAAMHRMALMAKAGQDKTGL